MNDGDFLHAEVLIGKAKLSKNPVLSRKKLHRHNGKRAL
jgi:hypothetical protein